MLVLVLLWNIPIAGTWRSGFCKAGELVLRARLGYRFWVGSFNISNAAILNTLTEDMYLEHERGQKVGYWCLSIDIGK